MPQCKIFTSWQSSQLQAHYLYDVTLLSSWRNNASKGHDNVYEYFDGLVQERRNSIANALELRLSCTNPSIWLSSVTRGTVVPRGGRVPLTLCVPYHIHKSIRNTQAFDMHLHVTQLRKKRWNIILNTYCRFAFVTLNITGPCEIWL